LEEICEWYIFVQGGAVTTFTDYQSLIMHEPVRAYLGNLLARRMT
jgi:hypothetical protein